MGRRLQVSSRAMWLLHALTGKKGARVHHLRGYGVRMEEMDEDVTALIASNMIEAAFMEQESSHLFAKFTPKGQTHLAQWRLEVARSVDCKQEMF